MNRVEQLKKQITELRPDEFGVLRSWFAEYDWQLWDRQIAADQQAGKIDSMMEEALREHAEGRTEPL